MNCHASEKTDYVPRLLLSSVIPMKGGGTLDAINSGKPGHHVAYEQRFGGWYLNHSIYSLETGQIPLEKFKRDQ